jgi:GNAT superfamily N-acetyltransferase
MTTFDPESLTLRYSCEYRGIPGPGHDPSDYPMDWKVSVEGTAYETDDQGFDIGDGEDVHVGDARVRVIPDAGSIDLLDTMDAVDSEVMGVAEMLFNERPDLVEDLEAGGDLLILSSLWIDPRFRGNKIGHTILKAILGSVGRVAALVVLQAAPVLSDDGPEEDTPEHEAAKGALRRYWTGFGFVEAAGDYLFLGDMAEVLA